MARIRSIKPEFPHSESVGRVSRDARLLFIQLWAICDDSGRTRGNSRMLASLLFPYDNDAPNLMDGWLAELEREGMIRRYQSGGDSFIDVPKWLNHQKIDKPSPSRHPPFSECSPNPRESYPLEQGAGSREQGVEQGAGSGTREQVKNLPAALRATARKKVNGSPGTPGPEIWEAYSGAYTQRYGVPPSRNRTVNSHLKSFGERLGASDAPPVAAFYVQHNRGLYVSAHHATHLLLRDAEGLRTEWATGQQMTDTRARQTDRSTATANAINELIAENHREEIK